MMDAVELPLPAAVAVSKLLTTEGFSRAGVTTVEEADARKTDYVSIVGSPPINGCISSCSPNDVMCVVSTSEQDSVSRRRKAEVGICRDEKQPSNFQSENITKQCGDLNSSLLMLPKSAGKQCNRKAGKVRSTSPCSKRQRTDKLEDTTNLDGTDDSIAMSGKLGSGQAKCTFAEKSRLLKQKHGHDGKRVKAKNKLDPFFAKAGLLGSSSAVGGNNILGIYGPKSDIHDATKQVDELSLNELLDGSYKCPTLCQDKGKKAANTNENILHSVRKACSILQLQRPVQKALTWLVTSGSCGTSSMDCYKVDTNTANLTSSRKPKDMLVHIALPPAKDLDSLLLDVAKPAVSSRSSADLRSSKLTSKRVGLPPFSWSHNIGLPCKTNVDVGKLCTTKSTCQVRWVRIGSAASSLGDACGCFSDLDSLTYDHSLVPSRGLKLGLPEDEKVPFVHVKLPWHESSSSTGKFLPASHIREAEWAMKYQGKSDILKGSSTNNFQFQEHIDNCFEKELPERKGEGGCADSCYGSSIKSAVGGCNNLSSNSFIIEDSKQAVHSPGLLAAAQILCDIASDFRKQNQINGKIRWPKKPSQKAMKARRSKYSTGKSVVLSIPAKSVIGSDDMVKVDDQRTLLKPNKFHRVDKRKDLGYNNHGRELIKCLTPASSRLSPSKLEADSVSDSKLLNTDMVNLLGMKPLPTRVQEECKSHQKPRKPLTVDWGRGRCKKE
ncbi:hypothetical protein NE237_013805 [Protea cynaroides]|uniref:Uncharacterized protein n=1 Tax=Protea cynaroides TaxID=273540 RepID=A0A9Q0GZB8_9MAGN|nr:hypothetical protein NE237_013805 [Protea cynaroides]